MATPHQSLKTELGNPLFAVGNLSLLSSVYSVVKTIVCFRLLRQEVLSALLFAFANAGNSIAARMAMMAITTSNSINVKPDPFKERTEEEPENFCRGMGMA